MGPTKSLVSVILPVYNAGPYLRPALNSLLKQDYERIEIIAIDDGSIDGSGRILREYRRLDKRLQVFSRENRGVVATLNEGISHANGSYIARMDADDIAYPDRIRRQLALLSENPDLAVCGSLYDVILSRRRGLRFEDRVDYSPRHLAVRNIFHSVLCHPTVLFNRFLLGPDLLRYDPDFEYAEDFELFSRISRTHAISVMRQPLLAYRAHSANTTSRKAAAMRAAMLRVVSTNLAHNGLSLERLGHVFSNPGSTAEVIQMLETIRHHRLAFDSCARPAYDSGFEHFVRVAVIEFCRDKGCSWTKTLCDDGELWPILGKRERWLVQRGGAMPGLALGAYRWGGRSLDLARSARLSDLIPQYRSICSSQ